MISQFLINENVCKLRLLTAYVGTLAIIEEF